MRAGGVSLVCMFNGGFVAAEVTLHQGLVVNAGVNGGRRGEDVVTLMESTKKMKSRKKAMTLSSEGRVVGLNQSMQLDENMASRQVLNVTGAGASYRGDRAIGSETKVVGDCCLNDFGKFVVWHQENMSKNTLFVLRQLSKAVRESWRRMVHWWNWLWRGLSKGWNGHGDGVNADCSCDTS